MNQLLFGAPSCGGLHLFEDPFLNVSFSQFTLHASINTRAAGARSMSIYFYIKCFKDAKLSEYQVNSAQSEIMDLAEENITRMRKFNKYNNSNLSLYHLNQ